MMCFKLGVWSVRTKDYGAYILFCFKEKPPSVMVGSSYFVYEQFSNRYILFYLASMLGLLVCVSIIFIIKNNEKNRSSLKYENNNNNNKTCI